MKKALRFVLLLFLFFIVGLVIIYHGYYLALNRKAKKQLSEVQYIEFDGFRFRDLNKNGMLDIYEDSRQDVEKRAHIPCRS